MSLILEAPFTEESLAYMAAPSFENFGQWVRFYRENHRPKYSLRVMADALKEYHRVDVTHAYISKLENDDASPEEIRPRPSIQFVEAFASLTGADEKEGMRLAGYNLSSQSRGSEADTDTKRLLEAYERATPRQREIFDALARAITEIEDEAKEAGK